jgi:hypothetical protein
VAAYLHVLRGEAVMRAVLVLCAATAVLVSSAVAQVHVDADAFNPDWRTILPEAEARSFARERLCNRPGVIGVEALWQPDTETIGRLETALAPALRTALDKAESRWPKPPISEYFRQYAAFVVGGRRMVYINAGRLTASMLTRDLPAWKTKAASVCDGGLGFFGAEYDAETSSITNLLFNGR